MHRILIIDDLQTIHDDFQKILAAPAHEPSSLASAKAALFGPAPTRRTSRAGFDVDHALQGEDGLSKVQEAFASGKRYTVAFVDMRMPPGWDGLQTIQRLWEADEDLQVVICTAYSDQSWEEISATLGLTDRLLILKKPFDPLEVLQLATALSEKWVLKHKATLKFDELERLVEQRTNQLEHKATHDALTGLPNRLMIQDRLARVIERADAAAGYAVLFLDFDRFKVINDSLGHDAGDSLLREIASRLTEAAGSPEFTSRCREAFAARLGGDEFVVILDGIPGPETAYELAQVILERLARPYQLKGYNLTSTASIGITTSRMPYERAEDAIRDADIAMYHAKAAGKAQCAIFDQRMHDSAMRRLSLENELCGVVGRSELLLHFQPVVDLSSGTISGFEALTRWNHPKRGLVAPGEFIPCAEETGTILPIGLWVLKNACRQLLHWRGAHPEAPDLSMSVNVSARQLVMPGFADQVRDVLAETGLPAHCLALELTESAVIANPQATTLVLDSLKALGVRLYLDDFGTGYSSLSYLHHLPMNAIKMDRSFLASLSERREYAAVVYAIVTLARNLGVAVIAEGVEKPEQLAMLQSMECEFGQGFLFGRPCEPAEAERFIGAKWAPNAAAA